ncbi:hypothetical protein [Actinoplanes regularis]|uniref:hypothetical protein n=1 Tax=Actinoplanes regularis TaxID=52697 RepID=UPI00255339A4|nr:hypothetical protein [Actinoplanes regularis]
MDDEAGGYFVELKYTGQENGARSGNPYNPVTKAYTKYGKEAILIDQAQRLLQLNAETGGRGVRYGISNPQDAAAFQKLFEDKLRGGDGRGWGTPGLSRALACDEGDQRLAGPDEI